MEVEHAEGAYVPEEMQYSLEGEGDSRDHQVLFVTGFPADVTRREVFNLFRFCKGYSKCLLRHKGEKPLVWIQFKSTVDAADAIEKFSGIRFDPSLPARLRLSFATSKLAFKKQSASPAPASAAVTPTPSSVGSSDPKTLYLSFREVAEFSRDFVSECLARLEGMLSIRWSNNPSKPHQAWVEFETPAQALDALERLQLDSVDSLQGFDFSVEFARNRRV